jgi:hypothetical protein
MHQKQPPARAAFSRVPDDGPTGFLVSEETVPAVMHVRIRANSIYMQRVNDLMVVLLYNLIPVVKSLSLKIWLFCKIAN